jgi:hypothetical protein
MDILVTVDTALILSLSYIACLSNYSLLVRANTFYFHGSGLASLPTAGAPAV